MVDVRFPIKSDEGAIKHAIRTLERKGVVTDIDTIKQELGRQEQSGLNGNNGGSKREGYLTEPDSELPIAMPKDSCERVGGIPTRGDDGTERCVVRTLASEDDLDGFEVRALHPAEQ